MRIPIDNSRPTNYEIIGTTEPLSCVGEIVKSATPSVTNPPAVGLGRAEFSAEVDKENVDVFCGQQGSTQVREGGAGIFIDLGNRVTSAGFAFGEGIASSGGGIGGYAVVIQMGAATPTATATLALLYDSGNCVSGEVRLHGQLILNDPDVTSLLETVDSLD